MQLKPRVDTDGHGYIQINELANIRVIRVRRCLCSPRKREKNGGHYADYADYADEHESRWGERPREPFFVRKGSGSPGVSPHPNPFMRWLLAFQSAHRSRPAVPNPDKNRPPGRFTAFCFRDCPIRFLAGYVVHWLEKCYETHARLPLWVEAINRAAIKFLIQCPAKTAN